MDCETVQHLVEVFNLFNYPWNVIYWTIPVLSLMDIARNAEAVKFQIRSVYTHSPRAGLRPIQPIRPRRAPRFEGPRTSERKENVLQVYELSSCQTTVMLDRFNCV